MADQFSAPHFLHLAIFRSHQRDISSLIANSIISATSSQSQSPEASSVLKTESIL
jgi:hypothetical protein